MAKKGDGYIRFRCKRCNKRLKVRETYEGGNVIKCPSCGATVTVPLVNIEAIAEATDMEETGNPGQIQLDAERLIEQLKRKDIGSDEGPGSEGATPSLREGPWSPQTKFGRLEELDDFLNGVHKLHQESAGAVQRLYRDRKMKPGRRADYVKDTGEHHREKLEQFVQSRLETLRQKIAPLEDRHERLRSDQLDYLEKLRRAREAIRFYARYVLDVDV